MVLNELERRKYELKKEVWVQTEISKYNEFLNEVRGK
jgi:hypothetical protein